MLIQYGGESRAALNGDAPPAGARDLDDVPVGVQPIEEAGDAGGLAAGGGALVGRAEEGFPDVAVAEPGDDVLAPRDGGEQFRDLPGRRESGGQRINQWRSGICPWLRSWAIFLASSRSWFEVWGFSMAATMPEMASAAVSCSATTV